MQVDSTVGGPSGLCSQPSASEVGGIEPGAGEAGNTTTWEGRGEAFVEMRRRAQLTNGTDGSKARALPVPRATNRAISIKITDTFAEYFIYSISFHPHSSSERLMLFI